MGPQPELISLPMPTPYGRSLALITDLYQLTMAYGYWRESIAEREAVFHHYFRRAPFGGAFAVAAGLATAVEWLHEFRFDSDDRDYLATLMGADGKPLFSAEFLRYLTALEFRCDIDAAAEGSLVFPQEPLARVRGPLLQCQLIETALLNIVNFQTLIATKAARVCLAAGGDTVLEFGLRRAQGIDGGLSASRAAYIGGCAATSNVLAGKLFGIPVRGTHAHSWVMAFDSEREAFDAYARAMPNNCIFLVDTYDTLKGLKYAVAAGKKLRERGYEPIGFRLDSGDLAALSVEARRLLDEAGLGEAAIIASNDLDERRIAALKARGARIDAWGVGTRLTVGAGEGALGGVYKLSALRDAAGDWRGRVKRSEDGSKESTPGMLQVRRYADGTRADFDLIYDELQPPRGVWEGTDPEARTADRRIAPERKYENLLAPVLSHGTQAAPPVSLDESRARLRSQLDRLPAEFRCLDAAAKFPVLFEHGLCERRKRLAAGVI